MRNRWFQVIFTFVLIIALSGCQSPTPPTELAPDGEIVEKAIALQLSQTETRLSQQLKVAPPELEISSIKVKSFDPVFIEDLPAYRLRGTYNLKLILPHQQVTQRKNLFDIYLQRQVEGKTWRLLRRNLLGSQVQWSSYLIQ